jgi:hypothetical protein
MWENIYKSAVKLKEMALPQKMKVSLCHQYFAIIRTPICYIFLLIIVTSISAPFMWPSRGLYKEVWFLMGFYLISFELAKIGFCCLLSPFIIVVCKKWPENSCALASNMQVGDKWSDLGTSWTHFAVNWPQT